MIDFDRVATGLVQRNKDLNAGLKDTPVEQEIQTGAYVSAVTDAAREQEAGRTFVEDTIIQPVMKAATSPLTLAQAGLDAIGYGDTPLSKITDTIANYNKDIDIRSKGVSLQAPYMADPTKGGTIGEMTDFALAYGVLSKTGSLAKSLTTAAKKESDDVLAYKALDSQAKAVQAEAKAVEQGTGVYTKEYAAQRAREIYQKVADINNAKADLAVSINSKKTAAYLANKSKNTSYKDIATSMFGTPGILKNAAKADLIGTTGTAQMYTDTPDGKAVIDKSTGVAFAQEAMGEVLFGIIFELPGAVKTASKISSYIDNASRKYDAIHNSPRTWVNLTQQTVNQLGKDFGTKPARFEESDLTPESMKLLWEGSDYGIHTLGQQKILLVSPKLGSMILHWDPQAGTYYMKGSDPKFLSTDAVIAHNGAMEIFTPDVNANKFMSLSGNQLGFDSIFTSSIVTKTSTDANLDGEDVIKAKNYGVTDEKNIKAIVNWVGATGIKPASGTKLDVGTLKAIANHTLAGIEFPLNDIDDAGKLYVQEVISLANNEAKNRTEFFENDHINDKFATEYTNTIFEKLLDFGKKNISSTNELSPIVKSLFDTNGQYITVSKPIENLAKVAAERAIIKAYGKVKEYEDSRGQVIAGIAEEDLPDIGAIFANEFMEMTGLVNDLNKQAFTQQLANSMNEVVGKDRFKKGFKKVNLKDGSYIYAFKERKGFEPLGEGVGSSYDNAPAFDRMFNGDVSNQQIIATSNHINTHYFDSLNRLNRYTNVDKSKARFGSFNFKIPETEADLKGFTAMLDKESLPIHYSVLADGKVELGNDAMAYLRMANTVYRYRDGAKGAMQFLQELENMNDVQLAKFLDKDIPDVTNATTLEELFDYNQEKIALIRSDIDALKREIDGHWKLLVEPNRADKEGFTFPVMKVSTTRMQYTGDINPQQGYLSKILLGTTKIKFDPKNTIHKRYRADAIRWALDEGPFLDLIPKSRQVELGLISDINQKFKGQRSKVSDDALFEIAEEILTHPEYADVEVTTIKDMLAKRNLENLDNLEKLMVEYDAITSMQGITNAIYSTQDAMTGINSDIASTGKDIYTLVGEAIQDTKMFTFFEQVDDATIRKLAKDPTMEGGYGMDPEAIAKSLFENQIKKAWLKNDIGTIDKINSDLIDKLAVHIPEVLEISKAIEQKLTRLETTQDLKAGMFDSLQDILAGTSDKRGKRIVDARILAYFDSLETNIMRIESSMMNMGEKLDLVAQIELLKDTAKVNSFRYKVDEGMYNSITAAEIEAVSGFMSRYSKGKLGNILDRAFGENFVNFKDVVTRIFVQGNIATAHVLDGTKITTQLKEAIYKDLKVKKSEKVAFENAFRGNTLNEFVDFLYSKGKDPLTSRTLYDILPGYINPFGDKVLYVATKNSGFDPDSGMQYLGLTPINNPLPYVFHSIDASIVGIAAKHKGALNMRWDAFYDLYSMTQAKNANKAMAYLYKSNTMSTFRNSYDINMDIISTYSGKVDMNSIVDEQARRAIVGNGDVLTADGKESKIKQIYNIIEDRNENSLYKRIIKEEKVIDDKITNIKDSDKITMHNYANGRDEAKWSGPAGSLRDADFKSRYVDATFGPSSFDIGNLTNINTKNVIVDPTYKFKTFSSNDFVFNMDINNIKFTDKATYSELGRAVTIKSKPNEPGFWQELIHELIHAVAMKTDTAEGVASTFSDIQYQLEQQGYRIGKRKKGVTEVYEKGLLEKNAGLSPIDPNTLYGNELAASMLDKLIYNEILHENREVIAKMQDTDKLKADPLIIIDQTGAEKELYTVNDLRGFLESRNIDARGDTLLAYANAVGGVINGSTHVRDLIFDVPKVKFESTLYDTFADLKNLNEAVIKVNEKIQDIPFLEIFELSKEKEVVETVLGLGKGVDKITYEVLNSVMDKLRKSFEEEFGDKAPQMARTYGTAWLMGLNKLMYKNMTVESGLDFMNVRLDGDLVRNGEVTSHSDMSHRFQRIEDKFFEIITNNNKTPDVKKAIKSILHDIDNLAEGVAGGREGFVSKDLAFVARDLERFARRNLNDPDGLKTSNIDFKLAVQKLASMRIIRRNGKHYNKFKEVYSQIAVNPQMFQTYMEHSNIHENPHSLFGENVDFKFLEGGKTVKAVKKDANANYAQGDIVGTAIAPDGTEFDIITDVASEKIIAAQESNLITMDLSNMEIGTFVQNVDGYKVKLNGQRIITAGSGINTSIITQLARNVYIRKKEDVSKDLGYRSWQMLRDNGIVYTFEEKTAIEQATGDHERFTKSKKGNPLADALGIEFYYDKRWQHYFEGTSGVEPGRLAKSLVGDPQYAKFVEHLIFGVYNLTNLMKRAILVLRPQSHFNSAFSSFVIYAHHADGFTYKQDYKAARAAIKHYKKLINDYADVVVKGDETAIADKWAEVKKDSIHKMMETGLSDTIKADVYKAGTNKEMAGYNAILRATGSHQYANSAKTFFADESIKPFKTLGDWFEMEEMVPKIMLYMNKRRSLGHQKAATTAIMAFPSYNNLNPFLNIINIVNPYMKFLASTPRMMMYGVNQNRRASLAGALAANMIVPASYAFVDDDEMDKYEFYKNHDFIKIPFLPTVYPSFSLFPLYSDFTTTPFGNSLFGIDFIPGVARNAFSVDSYLPGTYVKGD